MISPEIISVLIVLGATVVMAVVGLYVKDMVITSIKKHLTEVLPGLFAIEFAHYRDKTDSLYAGHDLVDKLETRVKVLEIWRAAG